MRFHTHLRGIRQTPESTLLQTSTTRRPPKPDWQAVGLSFLNIWKRDPFLFFRFPSSQAQLRPRPQ